MQTFPYVQHHGAVQGVTGSCHQFHCHPDISVLIDCGLFQGAEQGEDEQGKLAIDFSIQSLQALILTHVHMDHVGRLPFLLAAGFKGPIYCSEPSAYLLPLVLEDAFQYSVKGNQELLSLYLDYIRQQLRLLPYRRWHTLFDTAELRLRIRLQRAGHILGSAYVECQWVDKVNEQIKRWVFSGDLGAKDTPLLPEPTSPWRADELVLESTYGDRLHDDRQQRIARLKQAVERALADGGTVLIPAFSIGRTQELLYELEEILHQQRPVELEGQASPWAALPIILDSPLASRFTQAYRQLQPFWDQEAQHKLNAGRTPLSFSQLISVDSHQEHQKLVQHLSQSARPAIVIAGSGMCTGGRILNYLKAMLGDSRHNVLFVGYQAEGTPGRAIQTYAPRQGYVELEGQRYPIRAQVETLSGYSAHADQQDLLNFVAGIKHKPQVIRLVHGSDKAKRELEEKLARLLPGAVILCPRSCPE